MNLRLWILITLSFFPVVVMGKSPQNYLEIPLPSSWQKDKIRLQDQPSTLFEQTLPMEDRWWRSFGDQLLDSLITVAVKKNFSVQAAINRISMAKAALQIARSNFFPTIGLNGGWTWQESSGNITSMPQTTEKYYDLSVDASWEIDVFGSIRKRAKAQKEDFMATGEEYLSVMVSLSAQIATAYISLRETQKKLLVVQRNVNSQEEILRITQARFNAGLASELDVSQAKSVYYNTKASLPQLEAVINQYINTLAVLLGTYPEDMRFALLPIKPLPEYIAIIGVGIPADLLRRRSDIRSAERQINAQTALLGASKADWLPQFLIKGSFGYASEDIKDLLHHKSMMYEVAPAISWTIFNGGKLINATKQAQAQLDQYVNQFNETVLKAIQETDNAMSNYKNSVKQMIALREVCLQGQKTLDLSLNLYKQGLSPFQNVLDAQRSLLTYENQLVQSEGNALLYLVSLYQALGGGWNDVEF